MIELSSTDEFDEWLHGLKNAVGRGRVLSQLERFRDGNFGDWKAVGSGVCECRIDFGPGYRVYYFGHGSEAVLLFCAGTKKTQARDIAKAIRMAKQLSKPS